MTQQYAEFLANSYLYGSNAPYIEELYEAYQNDPNSVPTRWRAYFEALQKAPAGVSNAGALGVGADPKAAAVVRLVDAYRNLGVLRAKLDPLGLNIIRPVDTAELDPQFYGLSQADMQATVDTSYTYFGKDRMTLAELVQALQATYCGTLAVEFSYIRDVQVRQWWAQRLESVQGHPKFDADKKKRLLERLTAAEGLEGYLNTKYVGVKRFSLDGGDTFIPMMDELVRYSAASGVEDIVIGMAHRGRLNALVNTLGKEPKALFAEFDHTEPEVLSSGDVKYHNGFSNNIKTPSGTVHLSMAYNPSHLEVVSPVQSGSVRARMDRRGDTVGGAVMSVTVHGDGAVIGQGIVQETLSQSGTRGYYVGGSIRIVINNQVQFTTSDPRDSRTSHFCSDIARMIDAPVLHVNGDDPEAAAFAMQLAVDYRQKFHHDVMIDLVCYRKLGHNEQDTPQITQPYMYKAVKAHPGSRHVYAQRLIAEGVVDAAYEEKLIKDYRAAMDGNKVTSDPIDKKFKSAYASDWSKYVGKPWVEPAETGVSARELKKLAQAITTVPESISVHPLVQKVLKDRASMGAGELPVDWGMGENMAYATLVAAGIPVRITGEDVGRGTFSHRQAVVHNQNRANWTEDPYIPLQHISDKQASFTIVNSVLSENGVMGFEYGYSTARPDALTIWEAQFGDFANGGQIMIDQFISSGETKWGRQSGLVLLLPHGFEGQGPEHSSARIERYLELSAEENWVVCQPTTAGQIFHLLRSQAYAKYRKPLVVFSPKSLLRNKNAAVPLETLTEGHFQMVIGETAKIDAKKVRRVVLCSGKVVYDLQAAREERKATDVAIVRVEQLHPFPAKALAAELKKYPAATEVVWCQDEPENQGPWNYVRPLLRDMITSKQVLGVSSRPACPAPATGYTHKHQDQQKALLAGAFAKLKNTVK